MDNENLNNEELEENSIIEGLDSEAEKPWEVNGADFDATNFTLGGLPPDGD